MSRERPKRQNRKSKETTPKYRGIERIGSRSAAAEKEGTLTPRLSALKTGSATSSRRTDSPRSTRSDRSHQSDSDVTTGHVYSLLRRSSVTSDKIDIDVRQEEKEEEERDLQEGALITPVGSNVDAWNSTADPDEVQSAGWGSSYEPYLPQDIALTANHVDTLIGTLEATIEEVEKDKVETPEGDTVEPIPEQIEEEAPVVRQVDEQENLSESSAVKRLEEKFLSFEKERQVFRSQLFESTKLQVQGLRAELQRESLARKRESEELRGLLSVRAQEAISLVNYVLKLNKTVGRIKAAITKVLLENKKRIGLLVEGNESLRKEIRELKESAVPALDPNSLTDLETFPEGFLTTDSEEQAKEPAHEQAEASEPADRDSPPVVEASRKTPEEAVAKDNTVQKPKVLRKAAQEPAASPKEVQEPKTSSEPVQVPRAPDRGVQESKGNKKIKPKANFS